MGKINKGNQRVSRGRGNQGDWVNSKPLFKTLPQHKDHNAAVEAKRQEKLRRKSKEKGVR